MRNLKYLVVVVALAGFVMAGCTDANKEAKKPVGTKDAKDSSQHDDHGHVHGPHGGEVFALKDAGITIECDAKYGQNLVMFFIYDNDAKTTKRIKCEKLTGSYSAGEVKTVSIPAVDTDDAGMSGKFEIEDEGFAIARKTTGAKIEFEVDGKKYTVDMPKDPHG